MTIAITLIFSHTTLFILGANWAFKRCVRELETKFADELAEG